ncbi:MAG: hypothetical protein WBO92_00485, partial [Candidatus Moraniibacteriota bacterium]
MDALFVFVSLGWLMTNVTVLADIGLRQWLGGVERNYHRDPEADMRWHFATRRFLLEAILANYSVLALMMFRQQDTAGPMYFILAALSW